MQQWWWLPRQRLNNTCTQKHGPTLEPKHSREAQLMWLLKENTYIEVSIQVSENQVEEVVPLTISKSFITSSTFGTYWLQFIIAEVPKSWLIPYTRHFDTNNDKRHQARTRIDTEVNNREYMCLVENGWASKLVHRTIKMPRTVYWYRTYITQMCPWIRTKLFKRHNRSNNLTMELLQSFVLTE